MKWLIQNMGKVPVKIQRIPSYKQSTLCCISTDVQQCSLCLKVACWSNELSFFLTVYSVDSIVGGLERLYHLLLPGGWRSVKGKRDSLLQLHIGQRSMFRSMRHFNDPVLQLNGTIYDVFTDWVFIFVSLFTKCLTLRFALNTPENVT